MRSAARVLNVPGLLPGIAREPCDGLASGWPAPGAARWTQARVLPQPHA